MHVLLMKFCSAVINARVRKESRAQGFYTLKSFSGASLSIYLQKNRTNECSVTMQRCFYWAEFKDGDL